MVQARERYLEPLTHVGVELLVEGGEIRLEYTLEHLVRRLAALVRLQHALNGTLAIIARDQIADEGRLIVRVHHLLRIGRVHEPIVHPTHRYELPFPIGVEEAWRNVEAPARPRPMFLVDGEPLGQPPRNPMLGRA